MFKLSNLSALNDTSVTLEYLNDEETKRRIIPIIYLTTLLVLGTPGNLMIIYIYFVKFKRKATHRTFVIALALADLLVCSFAIPFEIYQMTREYTFETEWLCKLCRTCKNAMTISSALILLTLSINRYWSICKPLRQQLRYFQALKCIACIVSFSIVFAAPEIFLTGIKIHYLDHNLIGRDCSDSENYAHTIYPMIYGTVQLVFYFSCTIILLVMCFLIGRQILIHVTFRRQFRLSRMFTKRRSKESSVSTTTIVSRPKVPSLASLKQFFSNKERNHTKHKNTTSPTKVTRTALVVSVCFVIVYMPYITIKLLAAITEGHIMPPSRLASIIMPLFSRTHFINNVVNFIIYLYMDLSFRKQCSNVLFSVCLHLVCFHRQYN